MIELVFRCTPDMTCTYANPAFLRYFSRTEEETIGRLFMPAVHPEDAAPLQQYLTSLTQDNPAGTIAFRVILIDGSIRDLVWQVRAFFDSNRHVLEYQYIGSERFIKTL